MCLGEDVLWGEVFVVNLTSLARFCFYDVLCRAKVLRLCLSFFMIVVNFVFNVEELLLFEFICE